MPTNFDDLDNKKVISSTSKKPKQVQKKRDHSHKVENGDSKKIEELDREQQILLKDNKEAIIDFLLGIKDSIRIEDLKIYELIYKCYRQKDHCYICNTLTNIICKKCHNNNYHINKEFCLCTYHWQEQIIDKQRK